MPGNIIRILSAKIKTKEMKFKKGKSMVKTNTNNHLDINK
jgi:hypothetical protein